MGDECFMIGFTDYYHLLGVSQNASKEEIKIAYRKLAKEYHPDSGGSNKDFIRLKKAFDTLYNDVARSEYDKLYEEYIGQYKRNKAQQNEYEETNYRYKSTYKNRNNKKEGASSDGVKGSFNRDFHTVEGNPTLSRMRSEIVIWRVASVVLFFVSLWLIFELNNEKFENQPVTQGHHVADEQIIYQAKYEALVDDLIVLENEYMNLQQLYNESITYIEQLEHQLELLIINE